jgi:transposase
VTRADAGNRRLAHRRARFDARDKKPVIANVAIARELASWCWSLAIMDNR